MTRRENDADEEWRDVPGWEGLYRVSNFGRVLSCARVVRRKDGRHKRTKQRILKPADKGTSGHLRLVLARDGVRVNRYVHRLVLDAFVGPPDHDEECRHLDGNPKNNCLENLTWGTRAANVVDMIAHGTAPYGSACGTSKLARADVAEIRALRILGMPGVALARAYGVSCAQVSQIANGKRWARTWRTPGSFGPVRAAGDA